MLATNRHYQGAVAQLVELWPDIEERAKIEGTTPAKVLKVAVHGYLQKAARKDRRQEGEREQGS